MEGLMYPAFQKFYNALSSLDRFDKDNDFFENISSLDNFFAEYRNITFVLQKSISKTPYKVKYEEYRDEYLNPWFVNKRNEVTKEHSIQMDKIIIINIYSPSECLDTEEKVFSITNDMKINELIESIKIEFNKYSELEIFFSVEYVFLDKNEKIDIYYKCLEGVYSMKKFLIKMYEEIGEECALCEKLIKKIDDFEFLYAKHDFCMTDDYVYYPTEENFERAQKMAMFIPDCNLFKKVPLINFDNAFKSNFDSRFQKFVFMNSIIKSSDLMPTLMIVYEDDTFSMESFQSDLKTTFYRKIHDITKIIKCEKVKEIYFMITYLVIMHCDGLNTMVAKERQEHASEELLVFMRVDSNLNEEEYHFEGSKMNRDDYIANVILHGKAPKLEYGKQNMTPIIKAFMKNLDLL